MNLSHWDRDEGRSGEGGETYFPVHLFPFPIYYIIRCALLLFVIIVLFTLFFLHFLKKSFPFLWWFEEMLYLCTRKTGTTPTYWRSCFSYANKERVLWQIFIDRNCSTSAICYIWWKFKIKNLSIPFCWVVKLKIFYNEEFDPGSGWTLATGLTHASRGAAWT